jgi:hypothetical protein
VRRLTASISASRPLPVTFGSGGSWKEGGGLAEVGEDEVSEEREDAGDG